MYDYPFELGVDIRNCYDAKDQLAFMKAYNAHDPKTPAEHTLAMKDAFRKCASLPSSFSFNAIASVNAIDEDREKVTVDSIKRHMDLYIAYGGNINWEHKDLVTGKVWDWAPTISSTLFSYLPIASFNSSIVVGLETPSSKACIRRI